MSDLEAKVARLEQSVTALTTRVTTHEVANANTISQLNAVVAQLTAQGTADQAAIDKLSTLADQLDAFDADVPASVPPPAPPAVDPTPAATPPTA